MEEADATGESSGVFTVEFVVVEGMESTVRFRRSASSEGRAVVLIVDDAMECLLAHRSVGCLECKRKSLEHYLLPGIVWGPLRALAWLC